MRKFCRWFISLVSMLFCGFLPSRQIQAGQMSAGDSMDSSVCAYDRYVFKLSLRVPQVYSNTRSLGYRTYKNQHIEGDLFIRWHTDGSYSLSFDNLENRNFKISGVRVNYEGFEDSDMVYRRFCWIGSNKTETFNTPTICFYLELEPSYVSDNNEDNSFYLMLAGKGVSSFKSLYSARIATRFQGNASGTQGCGCRAYGHKSPTRTTSLFGPTDETTDVVSTWGTWTARWKERVYCK